MSITLMAEDQGGSPADVDVVERWADRFGLTFPVLADPQWGESNKYEQDFGIPTYHLLGRDLTIRILDGYVSPAAIQEALDEPIPEVPWDEPPSLDEIVDEPADDGAAGGPDGFSGSEEAPFGGCSASVGGGSSTGWLALLGLTGLLGVLRRRHGR